MKFTQMLICEQQEIPDDEKSAGLTTAPNTRK